MTVSKAFGLLDADALLVRQRGRAMVVAQQPASARSIADRAGLLRPTLEHVAQESRELRVPQRLVLSVLNAILGHRKA